MKRHKDLWTHKVEHRTRSSDLTTSWRDTIVVIHSFQEFLVRLSVTFWELWELQLWQLHTLLFCLFRLLKYLSIAVTVSSSGYCQRQFPWKTQAHYRLNMYQSHNGCFSHYLCYYFLGFFENWYAKLIYHSVNEHVKHKAKISTCSKQEAHACTHS